MEKLDTITTWCIDNFGELGKDWAYYLFSYPVNYEYITEINVYISSMTLRRYDYKFCFHKADDFALFQLTWG